ncbi:60 kDa chaperonin 2 [Dissostichus eleginoides]|uniref:60 kDa chaperonin 2 n=1 Tax=Dissostichus eleginoides TaxID=100907 RepID=A0AAD9B398_DISEL|nr:60 kDa chaperonin 2 [Dissostichus eleginoides]
MAHRYILHPSGREEALLLSVSGEGTAAREREGENRERTGREPGRTGPLGGSSWRLRPLQSQQTAGRERGGQPERGETERRGEPGGEAGGTAYLVQISPQTERGSGRRQAEALLLLLLLLLLQGMTGKNPHCPPPLPPPPPSPMSPPLSPSQSCSLHHKHKGKA